jgi:hypothetical protein
MRLRRCSFSGYDSFDPALAGPGFCLRWRFGFPLQIAPLERFVRPKGGPEEMVAGVRNTRFLRLVERAIPKLAA